MLRDLCAAGQGQVAGQGAGPAAPGCGPAIGMVVVLLAYSRQEMHTALKPRDHPSHSTCCALGTARAEPLQQALPRTAQVPTGERGASLKNRVLMQNHSTQ